MQLNWAKTEDVINFEKMEENRETPVKKARPKKEQKPPVTAVSAAAEDDTGGVRMSQFRKILGLLFILFSILMSIAFCSYLFTAGADQTAVNGIAGKKGFSNGLGSMGAYLSDFLMHRFMGLSALFFPVLLFGSGFNLLLGRRIFPLFKILVHGLLITSFLVVSLGWVNALFLPSTPFALGGAIGDFIAGDHGWLTFQLKPLGTGLLLLGWLMMLMVIWFNPGFEFLLKPFERRPEQEPQTEADHEASGVAFRDESENIFGKDQIEKEDEIQPYEEMEEMEINFPEAESLKEKNGAAKKKEKESAGLELQIEEMVPAAAEPESPRKGSVETLYDPTLDLSNYEFPPVELLEEHGSEKVKYDPAELERNKDQIIATLNNYQIEISKIKATIGPTVTLYEIVPAPGVRISKIKNLEDDIALSLSALGIRIIAPIPGKGTIGIEVPNASKEVVSMRSLLNSDKFRNTTADLPVCLGKSISNEIYVGDLSKMPHLLMAGATGQGKSVGINSIIVSLLYKKHPSQLKFVLVDPKKVELSLYETLERHFLAKLPGEEDAIITDTRKVVTTLNALCVEMDLRYDLLKKASVRNLKEYNHKFTHRQLNPADGHRFLPYIVLIIDEFADLIMTAGKEVEMPIARLAQLARAIGIHLILATQRPSVNIITGTIKANFPARIAFKTSSKVDSRTILDMGGAEQLIGRGDMLLAIGSDTLRLQCGFVDTPEVEKVRDFISHQQSYPDAFLLPEYIDEKSENAGGDWDEDGNRDDLFEDAARVVVQNQLGSTSLIQRRLKLGYNRAGRLMDQLESAGIVGENLGSKAREVKIKTEAELEQFLGKLREA